MLPPVDGALVGKGVTTTMVGWMVSGVAVGSSAPGGNVFVGAMPSVGSGAVAKGIRVGVGTAVGAAEP
jgi:hypothetical protein